MGRSRKKTPSEDNGFAQWGGYMEAKKSKLEEQYAETASKNVEKLSDILKGVSIFVNGLTNPNAEELKILMATNGGIFHLYQNTTTTHIIASNLPNVKINKLGSVPIVKPSWITDSLTMGKLLDYKRYLLYTNQSTSQPPLSFPVVGPKTASDPNFLEEFYSNSRLHLIATLGAEFKHLVSEWRLQPPTTFPSRSLLPRGHSPTPPGPIIMHIDMDCFFVSVGLRTRPELKGLPVAVTHARNPQINATKEREASVAINLERLPQAMELVDGRSSMSEIASCSYEARKFGIRNGMFLGAAAKLCPTLKTIPYDFEGYKEVSTLLYKTIASYTLDIEAVSCDEMYVDVTEILMTSEMSVAQWAEHIRSAISGITNCPCSAGFGANRLQARMATKRAKPAGFFHLSPDEVEDYMGAITLSDLPGVGRATLTKLNSLGLKTCSDLLQLKDLRSLREELGLKCVETLLEQCKGVDRKVLNFNHERKSVSAEINYGIRFKNVDECWSFLQSLSVEVWDRLSEIKMKARCVSLRLMVRAQDAPLETAKFLGHGLCDNVSRSVTVGRALLGAQEVFQECKKLYEKIGVPFGELRGLGIQLSKLEKEAVINPTLQKFLQTKSTKIEKKQEKVSSPIKIIKKRKGNVLSSKNQSLQAFLAKPKNVEVRKESEKIDLDVLNALPPELRLEIMKEYNLTDKEPIVKTKKSPFSGLEWKELKPILYDWIQSETVPKSEDTEMLGDFLRQLAMDREIDLLKVVFNFLFRVFEPLNCQWHEAYSSLTNLTQQGMVASYGTTLSIKKEFSCCQI